MVQAFLQRLGGLPSSINLEHTFLRKRITEHSAYRIRVGVGGFIGIWPFRNEVIDPLRNVARHVMDDIVARHRHGIVVTSNGKVRP